MKIDSNFVNKIFNLEIKLKNKADKIKLSNYDNLIPMYDIYSTQIYPIYKNKIYTKLIDSHYRFINNEIHKWLHDLYNKNINKEIGIKYKNAIAIIDNYDIPTLLNTSYKTLYKYSSEIGLLVSICKRNSFNPYIKHLKPYYTKLELIKLGQNMNIIDINIEPENLLSQTKHFEICKLVSNNDVSFDEINKHEQYILNNNLSSWVCFCSFTGSFLYNNYLRQKKTNLDKILYNGLYNIINVMKNAPELDKDYKIYRLLWDDSFINNLNIGDIFMDKGFLSTTRDPFYSPGLNGSFGLILLKIKVPKNIKGLGLFIENFSLFPKEEEFLIAPYSKLKLISKNNNFKYYHVNKDFEELINKKYEFELLYNDYSQFYLENPLISFVEPVYFDLDTINLNGIDRIDIIKTFIKEYSVNNQLNVKIGQDKYSFIFQWFDSTELSSYKTFYYNKIKDGILFSLLDTNGYPYLNIELGKDLAINWLNKYYFGNSNIYFDEKIINLIYYFGKIFYYKTVKIFHIYNNFTMFNKNYNELTKHFLNLNLYNNSLYLYLKNNKKFLSDFSFIDYDLGYWYLDEYFNKLIPENITLILPPNLKNTKTFRELFINTVEKEFNYYPKLIEIIDKNIKNNDYVTYNIYNKQIVDGNIDNLKPNIEYSSEKMNDINFNLIFRQPNRRI